jgi:hypothetical protein
MLLRIYHTNFILVDFKKHFNYSKNDMAEAAIVDTAPTQEAPRTPERNASQVQQETKIAASNLFFGKIRETLETGNYDLRSARAFSTIDFIQNFTEDRLYLEDPNNPEQKKRRVFSLEDANDPDDQPIMVSYNDTLVQVLDITDCTDDFLICQAREGNGTNAIYHEIKLTRQALGQAFVAAEQEEIINAFTDPAEQTIITAYAESVDPKKPTPITPSVGLDTALTEVAKKHTIPTVEDVQSFFNNLPQDMKNHQQAEAVLHQLTGKIILSSQDISAIIQQGGLNRETLGEQILHLNNEITTIKGRIATLRTQVSAPEATATTKKVLQEHITDLEEQITAREAEQQLYGNIRKYLSATNKQGQSLMDEYTDKILTGDTEQSQAFMTAFRSGDVNGILDTFAAFAVPEDATPEQRAAIARTRQDVLKNIAKAGGIGTLGALGIIAIMVGALGFAAVQVGSGMFRQQQ